MADDEVAQSVMLFVYGTLMREMPAAALLEAATFIEESCTLPEWDFVSWGHYPALVCGGRRAIEGEVFAVPAELLPSLDAYEGAPVDYERVVIALYDGKQATAYIQRRTFAAGRPHIQEERWSLAPTLLKGLIP